MPTRTPMPRAPIPTGPATPALSRRVDALASSRIRELLRLVDRPGVLSLAGGLPAPSTLDAERVGDAARLALGRQGTLGPTALQYGPTEGIDELRAIVAERHDVELDHVLITTGSQQAIDLLARTLGDVDDTAVVEAPSYLGALQSFTAAQVRVHAIDGDEDGLDVGALEEELSCGLAPSLVYVVANFHNPTGSVLRVERRRRLAALSAEYGFFVIEDDPYGELRFDGDAVPCVATFGGHVVRLGSASKILAPGLRIGWMVGPPAVIEAATRLKQAADLHTPSLNQLIVATLLRDTERQADHLDTVRELYRRRAGALHHALQTHLGDRVTAHTPRGGMFVWANATDETDTHDLFAHAIDHGVAYVPGTAFSVEDGRFRTAMRLSFATLTPEKLNEAVRRLAAAWP